MKRVIPTRATIAHTLVRNGPLLTALGLSVGFHLMMVTVFAVVIRFPKQEEVYLPVDIVHLSATSAFPNNPVVQATSPPGHDFQLASPDQLLAMANSSSLTAGEITREPSLFDGSKEAERKNLIPPIELTKLQLTGERPKRTSEERLQIRPEFSYLLEPKPTPDSWAVFTEELHGFGRAVGRITLKTLFGEEETSREAAELTDSIPLTTHDGIVLTVRWSGQPRDRAVVFAPPIQALWNVDPSQLRVPIRISIKVASDGKVIEVHAPINDEAGIAEGVGEGLRHYRFTPLTGTLADNQYGTVTVAPEPRTP